MRSNIVGIARDSFKYALDGRTSSSFVKGEEVVASPAVLKVLSEKKLIDIKSNLPSVESNDKINELNDKIEALTKENEELKKSSDSDLLEQIKVLTQENEDLKVKIEDSGDGEDWKQVKDALEKVINDQLAVDSDKRKGPVNIVSSLIDYLQTKPEDVGE